MLNPIYDGYNQNMLIEEHFDLIQNQIDIVTEEEINRLRVSGISSEKAIQQINELRKSQLRQVEQIKKFNFDHNKRTQEEFYAKWRSLIENKSIEYGDKLDILKTDLIVQDCVTLKNPVCQSKITLLLFGWYVNKKGLTLLK